MTEPQRKPVTWDMTADEKKLAQELGVERVQLLRLETRRAISARAWTATGDEIRVVAPLPKGEYNRDELRRHLKRELAKAVDFYRRQVHQIP